MINGMARASVVLFFHNCLEAKSLTCEVRLFYTTTGTKLRLQKEDIAMDYSGESTPPRHIEGDARFQTHLPAMCIFR